MNVMSLVLQIRKQTPKHLQSGEQGAKAARLAPGGHSMEVAVGCGHSANALICCWISVFSRQNWFCLLCFNADVKWFFKNAGCYFFFLSLASLNRNILRVATINTGSGLARDPVHNGCHTAFSVDDEWRVVLCI